MEGYRVIDARQLSADFSTAVLIRQSSLDVNLEIALPAMFCPVTCLSVGSLAVSIATHYAKQWYRTGGCLGRVKLFAIENDSYHS